MPHDEDPMRPQHLLRTLKNPRQGPMFNPKHETFWDFTESPKVGKDLHEYNDTWIYTSGMHTKLENKDITNYLNSLHNRPITQREQVRQQRAARRNAAAKSDTSWSLRGFFDGSGGFPPTIM